MDAQRSTGGMSFFKKCAAGCFLVLLLVPAARAAAWEEDVVRAALDGREGALVVIDTATGEESRFNPELASKKLAPCSTFKIWNTLIGLETGVLESADQDFYRWDGVERFVPGWNQNLTLREAFRVSCVPAFQELARKIGSERMKEWVDRIGYGDRDVSSGLDIFWLPGPDRKPLLITAEEQARLMAQLALGQVPFSPRAQATLKDIMTVQTTDQGTLYGKTGTDADAAGNYILGWFVGYLERGGKTYAFACVLQDQNVMGKDARAVIERVFLTPTPTPVA